MVIYEKYMAHNKVLQWCCACLPTCQAEKKADEGETPEERGAITFMRDRLAPFIYKWRYAILVFSGAFCIANLGVFIGLYSIEGETPDGQVPTHPLSRVSTINTEEFFVTEDWAYRMRIIYGLDTVQTTTYEEDGQLVPPSSREYELVYNDSFKLGPEEQKAMVDDCNRAKEDESLVKDGEVYCLLNELKKWRKNDFPYAFEADLRQALEEFYDSQEYQDLLDDKPGFAEFTGYQELGGNGIRAYFQGFNTTMPRELANGVTATQPYFDAWENYTTTCFSPCFHMLDSGEGDVSWTIYSVLRVVVDEMYFRCVRAPEGSGPRCARLMPPRLPNSFLYVTLACLVVMVISTRNIVIAVLVVFTVTMSVMCVISTLFMQGRSIGIYESLLAVITIGLALDYSVHLAHFYAHAKGTRYQRTQTAIADIGISILGGAATTIFAGVPLLANIGLFGQTLGFFLLSLAGYAIVLCFILLCPLFMLIGPEGVQGDVVAAMRYICSCGRARTKTNFNA